jgi:putative intracellular protease/amidase
MKPTQPVRRLALGLRGVGLSAAWLAGVGAAGAVVSMRDAYPRAPQAAPGEGWPPARPVPEGRLAVAVVLGASGSVITDALGPYEVFARSPAFSVYTVSASGPTAMLSGGLAVVPDHSLEDVDAGLAPEPDVVVVPAVAAPNGRKEAPLREWITRRVDRGAHLLSVCNGSRLLAATGLLDGRRATAHWSSVRGLQRSRPQVDWVRGQRYVQDGALTTTAGVTSGVFGALRLVEQLAGAAEAQRVGRELAYPGWSLHGPTEIRAQRWAPPDLAFLLAVVVPWWRPTVGVGLVEGVGELEVAAPFEVYAPLLGWAADRGLDVELPNGGQAVGQFSFDAMLGDLAGHSDQTTARSIEYPTEQLELAGAGWPWRPTALLALTVTAGVGVALLPAAATRRNRR